MRTTFLAAVLSVSIGAACKEAKPRPRPITDVVSLPAGEFLGQASTCPDVRSRESVLLSEPNGDYDVRQRIEAFEIERLPATCEDWLQCKRAGVCRRSGFCDPGDKTIPPEHYAAVKVVEAQRLCAWRGGRLPTLPELQRALRGTAGALHAPGWDAQKLRVRCARPEELSLLYPDSCEQTSPDGVIYYTEAHSELTDTLSCGHRGGETPGPTRMVIGSGGDLTAVVSSREANAFGIVHCVREPDATAAAERR